ncbi:MAG TPA: hypothetical protein VG345_14045, partial [Bryobacteraceae bacterium]|nr:hypothetical protein [Bryobacteraceae bacterium]
DQKAAIGEAHERAIIGEGIARGVEDGGAKEFGVFRGHSCGIRSGGSHGADRAFPACPGWSRTSIVYRRHLLAGVSAAHEGRGFRLAETAVRKGPVRDRLHRRPFGSPL